MTLAEEIKITEEISKAKAAMEHLMECVEDETIPKEEREAYYSDYLQVSANYLVLVREALK